MVHRIGLTGGVGSGKSTVAGMLHQRGAAVIDADAISRACTAAGGSAIPEIARAFGADFVTAEGAMDRERMRKQVFADASARTRLESVLHPLIAAEIERQASLTESNCLVFDVPLLVESPRWRRQLDRVIVVDCTRDTQIRRVQARNHWDLETIERVLQSQSTRSQRLAAADTVIFNDGNEIEHLHWLIDELAQRFGL